MVYLVIFIGFMAGALLFSKVLGLSGLLAVPWLWLISSAYFCRGAPSSQGMSPVVISVLSYHCLFFYFQPLSWGVSLYEAEISGLILRVTPAALFVASLVVLVGWWAIASVLCASYSLAFLGPTLVWLVGTPFLLFSLSIFLGGALLHLTPLFPESVKVILLSGLGWLEAYAHAHVGFTGLVSIVGGLLVACWVLIGLTLVSQLSMVLGSAIVNSGGTPFFLLSLFIFGGAIFLYFSSTFPEGVKAILLSGLGWLDVYTRTHVWFDWFTIFCGWWLASWWVSTWLVIVFKLLLRLWVRVLKWLGWGPLS